VSAFSTAANPTLDRRWRVELSRLQDDHVAPIRELLYAVSLAVGLLLLIVCANLAMLQAGRARSPAPIARRCCETDEPPAPARRYGLPLVETTRRAR
jgi:hypothetical protein